MEDQQDQQQVAQSQLVHPVAFSSILSLVVKKDDQEINAAILLAQKFAKEQLGSEVPVRGLFEGLHLLLICSATK